MYCFFITDDNNSKMILNTKYRFDNIKDLYNNLEKIGTKESLNILKQIQGIMYLDAVPFLEKISSDDDYNNNYKNYDNEVFKVNVFKEYNFNALANFNFNEVLNFLKENNEIDAFNYFRCSYILMGIASAENILSGKIKVDVKRWEDVVLNSNYYALLDLKTGLYIGGDNSRVSTGDCNLRCAKLFNSVKSADNFREKFKNRFSIVEIEMNVNPVSLPENVINIENDFQSIMSRKNIQNSLNEENLNLENRDNKKNKRKI